MFIKEMTTPYCELGQSARSWTRKSSTLCQEVVRRSLHVTEEIPTSVKMEVLKAFTTRLLNSGYSREQARHIMYSGLITYKSRRASLPSFYRSKKDMRKDRELNKILERTHWYEDKDRPAKVQNIKPGRKSPALRSQKS